jgi:hypothetical protein
MPLQTVQQQPIKLIDNYETVRHQHYERQVKKSDFRFSLDTKIPSETNPITVRHQSEPHPPIVTFQPKKETNNFPLIEEQSRRLSHAPDMQILKPSQLQTIEAVSNSVQRDSSLHITPRTVLQQSSQPQIIIRRSHHQSFGANLEPLKVHSLGEAKAIIRIASQNQVYPSGQPTQPLVSQPPSSLGQQPKSLNSVSEVCVAPIKPIHPEISEPKKSLFSDEAKKSVIPVSLRRSAAVQAAKTVVQEQPDTRRGMPIHSYTEQLPVETKIVGSKTFVIFVERGFGSAKQPVIKGNNQVGVQSSSAWNKNRPSTGTDATTKYK